MFHRSACHLDYRPPWIGLAVAMVVGLTVNSSDLSAAESLASPVDFNRDIRPILSDKCFRCHGPDSASRQAELRLDRREDAVADRDGTRIIAPGQPTESVAFHRMMSADADERMPPADSGLSLTKLEIETFRRWIEQGAEYQRHWSFIPPSRPLPPAVKARDWPQNPIDFFVLARLEREGLAPSPPAEKSTLLRRVTLDLTGLPPTLAEIDAFEADTSADALEKVVDRLFASPHYGEKMALHWLDAARYADTNGYFVDNDRTMWPWRDWVIGAFNNNMPFDQFTVEQLAGDLLPKPTLEQRLATGFNRNHMVTYETGIIDEEYRVEYVVDRVETTSTTWLGLTMGCARCHDHKYDPISQKEFYQFFAFFNNVPEQGNTGRLGNAEPFMPVASPQQQANLDKLRGDLAKARATWKTLEPKLASEQANWERTASKTLAKATTDGLVAHYEFDDHAADTSGHYGHVRLQGDAKYAPGLVGPAIKLDGKSHAEGTIEFNPDRSDAFSFGGWVNLSSGSTSCVLSKLDDTSDLRGFDLLIEKGKAAIHLVHRWDASAIKVTTKEPVGSGSWRHLFVTYDGSSKAAGVAIYVNGKRVPLAIEHDRLDGSIQTDEPLRLGRRTTSAAWTGMLDDIRLYSRRLDDAEVRSLAGDVVLRAILAASPESRTKEQTQKLRDDYLANYAPVEFRAASEKVAELTAKERAAAKAIPTAMVMQEMEKPRDAFLLVRGQYDKHGEKVSAATPASLPRLPAGLSPNRLALAKWLVDPTNPLTARVTVNRFWQQCFGEGIVKTVEDFGSQGEWPTHPELLDWLATEFIRSGWDVKHIHRLIVTSATYAQSSRVSSSLLQRDPENRLLARGPRFRMPAEITRDQALAMSGLLSRKVGGPSVKPYQPPGLWEAVSYDGDQTYEQDQGEGLYRRSMYTFWKRQSPPPALLTFDAPTRETCAIRRSRTNTPLQALVLLNDPTFVEAARVLAQRMMREAGAAPSEKIEFAFRTATARRPDSEEVDVLLGIYRRQLAIFREDRNRALKVLSVGEAPADKTLNVAELAAWTTIASMILNLDETITK